MEKKKYALISVSDKSGIAEFAKELALSAKALAQALKL